MTERQVPPGAIVELVEPGTEEAPVIPSTVLVNGTDVGLLRSCELVIGNVELGEPTVIRLELFPRRVVIRGDET